MFIKTLVLLTSINFASLDVPSVLKEHYRTHHQRIESVFTESLKASGYKLDVRHFADQNDLWKALQDPNVAGVFWVSHAGASGSVNKFTSGFSDIIDQYGYDISPAFQGINDNIGFLGLIGCDSKKVFAQRSLSPIRADDNPIKVTSFDATVDAIKGLKTAISEFKKFDKNKQLLNKQKICRRNFSYPVVVNRNIPLDEKDLRHPSVRIETSSGKVLGTFPKAFPGDTQSLTVHLDSESANDNFNFYVNAGNNAGLRNDEISIGDFEFQAGWEGQATWRVLNNPQGKPMGITRHYYTFSGDYPDRSHSTDYDACFSNGEE